MARYYDAKKALSSAFFVGCFVGGSGRLCGAVLVGSALLLASVGRAAEPAGACRLAGAGESVQVASVIDGDTVLLRDHRRVRLLAFDTPELDHDHPERSSALAREARKTLQYLLPRGSAVRLLPEQEKYDRYGRTLAQLLRADGSDVAQPLLERGLAHVHIVPPNDRLWRCYQRYEASARQQRRGIWALSDFQLQPVATLQPGPARYRLLHGRVTGSRQRGEALTLWLDQRLQVRVSAANAGRFTGQWRLPGVGQPLALRGQLHWRDGNAFVELRHPQALEPLPSAPAAK